MNRVTQRFSHRFIIFSAFIENITPWFILSSVLWWVCKSRLCYSELQVPCWYRSFKANGHVSNQCKSQSAKSSVFQKFCSKKPEREFDNFLKRHFDAILDFRKKTHWKLFPVDNCREYLDFPPVIHTGKGESANEITFFSLAHFQPRKMSVYLSTNEYQFFNFFCAMLVNCHLKTSILKSSPLSGQTDGLEIIRFKTPYLY